MPHVEQEFFTFPDYLSSHLFHTCRSWVGIVHVVKLHVVTLLVLSYEVCYDFRVKKQCSIRFDSHLFDREFYVICIYLPMWVFNTISILYDVRVV